MSTLPYTHAADLGELERLAWIANDSTTLALIEMAEDAAGLAAEEVRERNLETRDSVKRVRTVARELAEAQAENLKHYRELQHLRDLASMVEYTVMPYTGIRYGRPTGNAIKPAPKWAEHLITALRRIASEQST